MLSKTELVKQLESLDAQEQALQKTLAEVSGAQRLCRHLLGKVERAEDTAIKAACAAAQEAEEASLEKAAAYQTN